MKMKKIFALPVLLLTGAFAMVSCSDDNDSNPILVQPTTFTINEIAEAQGQVDLKQSSTINMTWSQPKFTEPNAPVIPTYSILVSSNGTFNQAYDDKADDNTGADYVQLGETYNTCSANIPTASINKALLQLNQWTEETLPANQTVSIRVMADIRDASKRIYYPILSDNAITLKTVPYYIELVAADPEVWTSLEVISVMEHGAITFQAASQCRLSRITFTIPIPVRVRLPGQVIWLVTDSNLRN